MVILFWRADLVGILPLLSESVDWQTQRCKAFGDIPS